MNQVQYASRVFQEPDRASVSRQIEKHAVGLFYSVQKSEISSIAGLQFVWNPRTLCMMIAADQVKLVARYREVWFRKDGRRCPAGEVSFWHLGEDANSFFCVAFGASGHTSFPGPATVAALSCGTPELGDHIAARLLFEMETLLRMKENPRELASGYFKQDRRLRVVEPTQNLVKERSLAKIRVI